MKVILSSKGFVGEESCAKITEELGAELSVLKVLFIPCAITLPTRKGKFYSMMTKRGFSRPNVTVFDPENAEAYADLDIDLIYTCGGNTFALLEKIRACGFGEHIKNYIKNGVTYVGASAGVHLISQNVEHLLPFDPNVTNTTDFTALGILDGIYFCHFDSAREPYYEQALIEKKYNIVGKIYNEDIVVLTDGFKL